MQISNFRDKTEGGGKYPWEKEYRALVDVTTGRWFWKKTRTERIKRKGTVGNWYFVDTGKFTPGWVVEELERSYDVRMQEGRC